MIEEHFLTWFNSNVSSYTFLSEYFYGDVEVNDEKSRKDLMYKWLLAAYEEGYKCGQAETPKSCYNTRTIPKENAKEKS